MFQKTILIFLLIFSQSGNSQKTLTETEKLVLIHKVSISARVDTSKVEIKKIYHLYSKYINSRPDSIYKNPYWKESENEYYLKTNFLRVDKAANQIFNYSNAKDYLSYYNPKIIQIDSIDIKRYQIKTIFLANCPDKDYLKFNPDYITKLYAVKNNNNEYKLENCIDYDTKTWKIKKINFITYYIHPKIKFNQKEAKKAIAFCRKISKQFNLPIEPFKYYVLPNSDELGKLYNFEYWLSYLSGQTNIPLREIYTTNSNFNFPHEFVHIIFPLPKNQNEFCPMLINEGLATWLGGPSYNVTFEEELLKVSRIFKTKDNILLDDIINFKFRNEFDNSILYITGAVICKLVYEKKGKEGILKIYNSNSKNYKLILEEIFETDFINIEKEIIAYIKNYNISN